MTIHRIRLKDLDAEFIRQLKEEAQNEEAEITIWFTDQPKVGALSEAAFWQIIAMLDLEDENKDDVSIAPAVEYLSQLSTDAIEAFEDILSNKLYLLDGRQFAENIGENAYQGEDHAFSADGFLYARCFVVAQGEVFYTHVLEDPKAMPKNKTFEALLSISSKAFKLKTGKSFEYTPTHIIETFANAAGWNGAGLLAKILSS